MDDAISLVLAVGMVLRATRLVATDTITAGLRNRLSGWVLKLVTCGWCVSMWIAGLVVTPAWWFWGYTKWWQAVGLVAVASWLAGAWHFAGQPSRHEVMPVGALPVSLQFPSGGDRTITFSPDDDDDDVDDLDAGDGEAS